MKSKILISLILLLATNLGLGLTTSNNSISSTNFYTQPRVALVLGGGGARGYAELGVLTVLQQAHIPIDLIVGTSVGSIVGSLYADDPNAADVDNILLHAKKNEFIHVTLFDSLKGPFSDKRVQSFFIQHLTAKTFNQLKIKFVAVATDLTSGATVPLSQGLIASAVNASAALPPFFHPVIINGETLVDGGASDPVAVDVAQSYAPKIIIAVDISQDLSTKMPVDSMGIMHRSNLIRGRTLAKLSERNANVVIQPNVGQTGVFDNSQKTQLFNAGEVAAQQALPQICALLTKDHIASNCNMS